MALINNNENYIKVIKDGCYYIYPNQQARDREKRATPASVIISTYEEKIQALIDDVERQYYDEEAWGKEYDAVTSEYNRYLYDLRFFRYDPGNSYPIMWETYPLISDSIPEIIESGNLMVESETTEEEYEIVKDKEYFGPTEDA